MNAPRNQSFEQLSQADQELTSVIANQLFAHQNFAFVVVDSEWRVLQVSKNLVDFGFPKLEDGVDVTDYLDVLVGLGPRNSIDLPIVMSPNETPVRVLCLPQQGTLTIIISDALDEYQRRQQLQQKANENEILLETQSKLLSDIEQAQKELEQKNRLLNQASKLQNTFLGGVSHEFRTPLASITGYVELLIDRLESQRPELTTEVEQLKTIRRGANHLVSLVENLLDHGRYDSDEISLNIESLDIASLFSDVVTVLEPLAKKKSLQLALETNGLPSEPLQVDGSKLRQCLFNIIGNAIKFTHSGSVVVKAIYEAPKLKVIISDTGEGIAAKDLNSVSIPFFQTSKLDKTGAGLGLSITQRIVELMGGELDIESTLGKGTTVSFDIFAVVAEASDGVEADVAIHQYRILLAEDDDDIGELLSSQLQQIGCKITWVTDGHKAIDAATQEEFDLVLMDLHMPYLDGYEATKAIKNDYPKLPILALTASSISQVQKVLDEAKFDGYLSKPVKLQDILNVAENLVGFNA